MCSTAIGIVFGFLGALFWMLTYIVAIIRSIKDKSITFPLTGTAAYVSWEFIYSFIYYPKPLSLQFTYIFFFFIDLILACIAFNYGKNEPQFKHDKNYFKLFYFT